MMLNGDIRTQNLVHALRSKRRLDQITQRHRPDERGETGILAALLSCLLHQQAFHRVHRSCQRAAQHLASLLCRLYQKPRY